MDNADTAAVVRKRFPAPVILAIVACAVEKLQKACSESLVELFG